jgi:hypothetical protein
MAAPILNSTRAIMAFNQKMFSVLLLFSYFCAMIKFGSRVVCINDSFSDEQVQMIPNRPSKDQQYTVDEVMITRRGKAVTLVEIDNPPLVHPTGLGTFTPSFDINRFREVDQVPATEVREAEEAMA